jgi:hypothetical protein
MIDGVRRYEAAFGRLPEQFTIWIGERLVAMFGPAVHPRRVDREIGTETIRYGHRVAICHCPLLC